MSFLGKVYHLERNENFEEYIQSLGVSVEMANIFLKSKPSLKLEKSGEIYILTSISDEFTKELKFKNGVEFDEEAVPGYIVKTVMTLDGNKLTQVQTADDGSKATFALEFSDRKVVVILTTTKWNGTAYRYYKS